MNKKIYRNQKGLAPVVIILIILAVLVIGGGVYYFSTKSGSTSKNSQAENKTAKSLADIKVGDLKLDFALSPIPALKASAFNVTTPNLSFGNTFTGLNVDSNFDYQGKVDIAAPDMPAITIPSGAPASVPSAPPAGSGSATAPPADQGGGQGSQPAVDCSQFQSVPNCSYVPANVQAICQQCKGQ